MACVGPGSCTIGPNLALVFMCLFCVIVSLCSWWMFAFVVLDLISSVIRLRDCLRRMSLKWVILCRVGRKTLTQSQQPVNNCYTWTTNHHNHFMALFPGPPGWASARRKLLLDFVVLGRTTRGRHTDNPRGRHSIRTNQQSTSINPSIF